MKAAEASEETKQVCVERIEHAMKNHCDNCNTGTTDKHEDMCQKHLKMYGKLHP